MYINYNLEQKVNRLERSVQYIYCQIKNGGGGGEPLFIASPAYTITNQNITDWNNKISVETDPIFTSSVAYSITQADIDYWNSGAGGQIPGLQEVTDVNSYTTNGIESGQNIVASAFVANSLSGTGIGGFISGTFSEERSFTLPDKEGTFAMLSDIIPEQDTFQSVTSRGAETNQEILVGGLSIYKFDDDSMATFSLDSLLGGQYTYQLPYRDGMFALLSDIQVNGGGQSGEVAFWINNNTIFHDSSYLWDNTNKRLAVGVTNPTTAIDTTTFRARSMPNAQGDVNYTKNVVAKADGTFGVENKASLILPYVPKVTIKSFSQDSTNYYIKVWVSGIVGSYKSPAFRVFCDANANGVEANNIVVQQSSVAIIPLPTNTTSPSANSIYHTLIFPKSSNTSTLWSSTLDIINISVIFIGSHNEDIANNIIYSVPRVGMDTQLKQSITI